MTREILFRGKSINGLWVTGLLSKSSGEKGLPEKGWYISNAYGMPFAYMVRPETVSQYTGLKDGDGKMIFEGDILEFWQPEFDLSDKGWGIVEYFADNKYPAFDIETIDVDSNGLSYIMANCDCKVIGNRWDNLELLEVQ